MIYRDQSNIGKDIGYSLMLVFVVDDTCAWEEDKLHDNIGLNICAMQYDMIAWFYVKQKADG